MSFETVVTHIIDWYVKYRLTGRYYPATLEEPAEYPEIYIVRVEPCDPDLYDEMVRAGEIDEHYFGSCDLEDIFCDMIAELEFN